jgi:methyltransferase of ATP-grasp peptide maturase system
LERAANRLRGKLVRGMFRDGLLDDPRWRAAFAGVPRHVLLPRFFRPAGSVGWVAVDSADPGWLSYVYADRVLVTQLDGDPSRWEQARAQGGIRGVPTSSSSMPAIMAVMLEALQVADGQRVLEVGTGTGYNAALLCHRLGDSLVSTVDVDAALIEEARVRVADCGYHPTCVAGDGADGYPLDAPYDRVLCTCSVSTIPLPWLEQTRPGGLVITALHRPLGAGVVRIVAGEGPCGRGRVLADDGRFMPLRAHRQPFDEDFVFTLTGADGSTRVTELPAATLASPASPFEFFAGLGLPDVVALARPGATVLYHPDGSWARHWIERSRRLVTQDGPRRLWDEAEATYARWLTLGRPRRSRFGITVDPTVQELWLDDPDGPHRWPLG